MLRQFGLAGAVAALALSTYSLVGTRSADAVIHEIVAAYCSGGGVGVIGEDGDLEPPGLAVFGTKTFARPVIASGAVDPTDFTVTSKPNTKFAEGTSVLEPLSSADATHQSAEHCVRNALP